MDRVWLAICFASIVVVASTVHEVVRADDLQNDLSFSIQNVEWPDGATTSGESIYYSHYFAGLRTDIYPFHEAQFVSREMRLFTGLSESRVNREVVLIRRSMFGIGAEISRASWPVGVLVSYASFDSDYVQDNVQVNTRTLYGRVTAYSGESTSAYLSIRRGITETDTWSVDNSSFTDVGLNYRTLFRMGERMFGAVNVGATQTLVDQGTRTIESTDYHYFFVWYPNRTIGLTFGGGGFATDDDGAVDSTVASFGLGWYITSEFEVSFEVRNRVYENDESQTSWATEAALRF